MPEHVENPILRPLPGEQPAEPPATPGTVTVLLTIPWTTHLSDGPTSTVQAEEKYALFLLLHYLDRDLKRLMQPMGFDLDNIETTATFEADQDPGDKQ